MQRIAEFFAFAHERHSIYLRRKAGGPWPWTEDPILRDNYFTNVYRELDRTTAWFREHVRDPLNERGQYPDLIPATLIFRWFNRVDMGEIIFSEPELHFELGFSIFENFINTQAWRNPGWLRNEIFRVKSKGPYVNGAYIIKAENGMDKLSGVCYCIEQFMSNSPWLMATVGALDHVHGLQQVWSWFKDQYYIGPFTGYEIVCDLRYTRLLEQAPDVMTWANPGPGAIRGLNRIWGDGPHGTMPRMRAIELMRELLSESSVHWPNDEDYPPWEMREVEHTLCEFDKYERVRLGQGRSKRRYTPPT